MKYQQIYQIAVELIQGWGDWDEIVETAQHGLSLDDLEWLESKYDEETARRIADEIESICREEWKAEQEMIDELQLAKEAAENE